MCVCVSIYRRERVQDIESGGLISDIGHDIASDYGEQIKVTIKFEDIKLEIKASQLRVASM